MFEEKEINNEQEILTEENIDNALVEQESKINFREKNKSSKLLTGLRKWVGASAVMGASLLAVGCGAEKSNDGFIDNQQQNIQQRLKIEREKIKQMKKMENYKPNSEAQKAAKEMQEEKIIQPIDSNNNIE